MANPTKCGSTGCGVVLKQVFLDLIRTKLRARNRLFLVKAGKLSVGYSINIYFEANDTLKRSVGRVAAVVIDLKRGYLDLKLVNTKPARTDDPFEILSCQSVPISAPDSIDSLECWLETVPEGPHAARALANARELERRQKYSTLGGVLSDNDIKQIVKPMAYSVLKFWAFIAAMSLLPWLLPWLLSWLSS